MAVGRLFILVLGVALPWKVAFTDFYPKPKSLELGIDFERGACFADSEFGKLSPFHDTVQRSWEHLKFFERMITIRARVPRIKTPLGAVTNVEMPRAKPNSGFTQLMEAFLLTLAKVLPVAKVAGQTGEVMTEFGT